MDISAYRDKNAFDLNFFFFVLFQLFQFLFSLLTIFWEAPSIGGPNRLEYLRIILHHLKNKTKKSIDVFLFSKYFVSQLGRSPC